MFSISPVVFLFVFLKIVVPFGANWNICVACYEEEVLHLAAEERWEIGKGNGPWPTLWLLASFTVSVGFGHFLRQAIVVWITIWKQGGTEHFRVNWTPEFEWLYPQYDDSNHMWVLLSFFSLFYNKKSRSISVQLRHQGCLSLWQLKTLNHCSFVMEGCRPGS